MSRVPLWEFWDDVARITRGLDRRLGDDQLLAALELWREGWTPYAALAQVLPGGLAGCRDPARKEEEPGGRG